MFDIVDALNGEVYGWKVHIPEAQAQEWRYEVDMDPHKAVDQHELAQALLRYVERDDASAEPPLRPLNRSFPSSRSLSGVITPAQLKHRRSRLGRDDENSTGDKFDLFAAVPETTFPYAASPAIEPSWVRRAPLADIDDDEQHELLRVSRMNEDRLQSLIEENEVTEADLREKLQQRESELKEARKELQAHQQREHANHDEYSALLAEVEELRSRQEMLSREQSELQAANQVLQQQQGHVHEQRAPKPDSSTESLISMTEINRIMSELAARDNEIAELRRENEALAAQNKKIASESAAAAAAASAAAAAVASARPSPQRTSRASSLPGETDPRPVILSDELEKHSSDEDLDVAMAQLEQTDPHDPTTRMLKQVHSQLKQFPASVDAVYVKADFDALKQNVSFIIKTLQRLLDAQNEASSTETVPTVRVPSTQHATWSRILVVLLVLANVYVMGYLTAFTSIWSTRSVMSMAPMALPMALLFRNPARRIKT